LIILIANAHPDRSERSWQKRPASRDLFDGLRLSRQSYWRELSVHLRRTIKRWARTNLLFTMSYRTGNRRTGCKTFSSSYG